MGIGNGEYSGVLLWVPGSGWLGRVNLKFENNPLPSVVRRPVPKAMMVTGPRSSSWGSSVEDELEKVNAER